MPPSGSCTNGKTGKINLKEIDVSDSGNIRTRLVHWTDEAEACERFAEAINRVRELMPEAEMAVISPAEIAFRCHGLEFARARLAHEPGTLRHKPEIVFGVGADEKVLEEQNADAFRHLVHSVGEVRHAEGPRDHALWRLHPERWLESLVVQDVSRGGRAARCRVPVLPGAGIFRLGPGHDRCADDHARRHGWRWWN